MSRDQDRGQIPLTPIGVPSDDGLYRLFLACSLAIAVLVGFALAIHLPATRLLTDGDPERAADLIQAHGQAQVLGFAGLFVIGVSLRLMPRFSGGEVRYRSLASITLALIAFSVLVRAFVLPWLEGSSHGVALFASTFSAFVGASSFLILAVGTLTIDVKRFEASSLSFSLGAFALFVSTWIGALAAVNAASSGERGLPYLVNTAVLHLEVGGFILAFIVGVGLRAIPVMVGIERLERGARLLAVTLFVSVMAFAAALVYLEYAAKQAIAIAVADASIAVFGGVLLTFVWGTGTLRQAANRLRPASQPTLWLIRSAAAWILVAGMLGVYAGASSLIEGTLVTQVHLDALRHALGIGVVTMLIAGMSIMILPEFAVERQQRNRQASLAIILMLLLNTAAALRVAAALSAASITVDQRNVLIAIAGTLAEIAILLFGVSLLRLMRRQS